MKLCKCGCGKPAPISTITDKNRDYKKGTPMRFINGHSIKTRSRGATNPNWKGGISGTNLYYVWAKMVNRCCNRKSKDYKNYGGRGITVCEEWLSTAVFIKWGIDNGWCQELEIDRIDNNKGYFPNNCHFVKREINARNTKASKIWHIRGTAYPSLRYAAKALGVSHHSVLRWCDGGAEHGKHYAPKPNCWSEKLYKQQRGGNMTEDTEKYETRNPSAKKVVISGDSPASMIRSALSQGADLGQLKEMFELQKDWEANVARKAYHAAMAKFKANPPEIDKDRLVSFEAGGKTTSYRHASLANITSKVNKVLGEQGLSAGWTTTQSNGAITVTCSITHEMGHSESTSLTASPDTSGSKNAIQAVGSTISYLERYTILALTGLATADMDDDGQGAGEPEFITEKQLSSILDMINSKNVDETPFLKYMKVEAPEKIQAKDFDKAIAVLKKAKGREREPGE